jgi:hypothetical protein
MGSGFHDWVCWRFFTIKVGYNTSHIELLLDNESLTVFVLVLWLVSPATLISLLLLEFTHPLSFITVTLPPYIRQHVEQFPCCPIGCHRNLVFGDLLPGKESFAAVRCNGNVIFSRCSTADVWLWLHYSGFQPSRHNITLWIMMWVTVYWMLKLEHFVLPISRCR